MTVTDCFVFGFLRFSMIDCSFNEVKIRQYEYNRDSTPVVKGINVSEQVVRLAEQLYELAAKRRETVSGKVSSLLTLSSLLLAIMAVFAPRTSLSLLLIAPFLAFSATVFLLVVYLGVGTHNYPDLTSKIMDADDKDQNALIAQEWIKCADSDQDSVDFLVDVFRAARRWFTFGLVLSVVAVVIITTVQALNGEATEGGHLSIELGPATLDELRELIEEISGPSGGS